MNWKPFEFGVLNSFKQEGKLCVKCDNSQINDIASLLLRIIINWCGSVVVFALSLAHVSMYILHDTHKKIN